MLFLIAFLFGFQENGIGIQIEDLGIQQFDTFDEQFSTYFEVYNNEVMPGKLRDHRYGEEFPLPEKSLIAIKFQMLHERNMLLLEVAYEQGRYNDHQAAGHTVASLRMLADSQVAGNLFDKGRAIYQDLLGYYEGMSVVPTVYYEIAKLEGRHGKADEEIRLLRQATHVPGFANTPFPGFLDDHLRILEHLGRKLHENGDDEGASEVYKTYFEKAAKWRYYIDEMRSATLPLIESMPQAYQIKNLRTTVASLKANKGSSSDAIQANLGVKRGTNYQESEKHLLIRNWKKMRRQKGA